MTTTEIPAPPKRRLRSFLKWLAALAVIFVLFHAEEDWRGWRAMVNYKRESEAKGAALNWADYTPAPVPDEQNFFGVPEMQKWFVGHGTNELTEKLANPGKTNPARTVVARLTIGLPGATPPAGSAVLQWEDPKAKEETIRLIKEAVGPVALDPGYPFYTKQPPGDIQAAQICLQCQTQPAEKQLQGFLPAYIFNDHDESEKVKVEPAGDGSYNVTMQTPSTVTEFLAWNEQLEPTFALIRDALQRPYARMAGDYGRPYDLPIPAFVSIRSLSQRLSAMSRCHMLLGQPGKALDELTFIHQLCRILESRPAGKPMTLVAAMINVAVTGLYVDNIEEGMKLKVWQEPQLAALQEQLKEINLYPFVMAALVEERQGTWRTCDPGSFKNGFGYGLIGGGLRCRFLIPLGWVYQNMVVCAGLQQKINESYAMVDHQIVPHKIEAVAKEVKSILAHQSLFHYLANIAIPNFTRAGQTLVQNQTKASLAQIVCALERYRLAHGGYPETLEILMPQYIEKIPNDMVGGQPPHYRPNGDGTFLLYSIGWSEQDHGGRSDSDPSHSYSDLVWPIVTK